MILASCTLITNTIATSAELTTQLHAHLAAYNVEDFETTFEQLKLVATADEFETTVAQLHEAVMKLIAAKQALICDKRSHHVLRGLHVCCGMGLGIFAAKTLQRLTRFELWRNLSCIYNPQHNISSNERNPVGMLNRLDPSTNKMGPGVVELTFDSSGRKIDEKIIKSLPSNIPAHMKNTFKSIILFHAIEELLSAVLTSAIIVALFYKAALDIQTGLTANTANDCQELKELETIAILLQSHLSNDSERNHHEPYAY